MGRLHKLAASVSGAGGERRNWRAQPPAGLTVIINYLGAGEQTRMSPDGFLPAAGWLALNLAHWDGSADRLTLVPGGSGS